MGQKADENTGTSDPPDEDDNIIVSSYTAYNAQVFPKILDLHVPTDSKIADVTYGKGVFWEEVNENIYDVHGTDLDPEKSPTGTSVDCRDLPYDNNSFDCVVIDPPYAEGFFRRHKDMMAGNGSHSSFRDHYSNGEAYSGSSKYHQAVLDLYIEAGAEAKRVLRDDGVFIAKVGDEVSSNTQELTHIQVTNFYEKELDFYTKDLFVVERHNQPAVSGMNRQVHARKNHSYFLVYEMDGDPVNIIDD
jgi:DNA modification methylase